MKNKKVHTISPAKIEKNSETKKKSYEKIGEQRLKKPFLLMIINNSAGVTL